LKLDAFTKFKAAMDKILVELKTQKKNKYDKFNLSARRTLMRLRMPSKWKQHQGLGGDQHTPVQHIGNLSDQDFKAGGVRSEVHLKTVSLDRKAETQLYRQSFADQHATGTAGIGAH